MCQHLEKNRYRDIGKALGVTWGALSEAERTQYELRSAQAREVHKREVTEYEINRHLRTGGTQARKKNSLPPPC